MIAMKEALISPDEPVQTGYRVAQVVADGQTFPVADPMFWTACADDVVADKFWYDPADSQIKPVSVPPDQTAVGGTQTL